MKTRVPNDTRKDIDMDNLEDRCNSVRAQLKEIDERVRGMMKDARFTGEQSFNGQHAEMKANIMLAVRHIEDARMRVGKILQYADDGVSILDKQ